MPGVSGLSGAKQWAKTTQELATAWGTFDSGATVKPWLEIEDGAIAIDPKPLIKESTSAPWNMPTRNVASKTEITGSFKSKAFPDLMLAFLPWACTYNVVSTQRVLSSFTLDWFDGLEPRRFRGCRVEEIMIESDMEKDWVDFEIKFRGRDQDPTPPTFTEPAVTVYPTQGPYVHTQSAANLLIGATTLTAVKSIKITYKNKLDPQYDDQPVLNSLDYQGREITWEVDLKITDAAFKTLYEQQTPAIGYIKWTIPLVVSPSIAARHMIFDLQGANIINPRTPTRKFGATQYQKLMLKAFRDPTSGLDCVATID